MSGADKHRLYFSKRCRHCQAFLEELVRTPYLREVEAICVDPSPSRPALPGWLKSVPTLLVAGESAPRVGPGPVTNWLFERKMGGGGGTHSSAFDDRRTPLSMPVYTPDVASRPVATGRGGTAPPAPSSAPSRLPPSVSGSAEGTKGVGPPVLAGSVDDSPIVAYHESEMSGGSWSDAYSFIGHEATAEKGYDPIARNFESLISMGGAGATDGRAGAGAGGGGAGTGMKRSAKEEALLRDFEAYAASRDRDVSPGIMRK